MAINYLRSTYAKKSREKTTAARDSADYILRQGKFKNLLEENENGQKNQFSKIEDGEKIVPVSEAVPKDWEKDRPKFGSQFRQFSKDADDLERANSQTLQRLVLALPRELQDQKAQQTYIKDFMKETGLDQQPHLAVMHIDPKNHNPHAHILFSARPLDFKCTTKKDGSIDLKSFFSRQNPKNSKFGSGDIKAGRAWTKNAMIVNQNLIRALPGLGNWKPANDGQKEHHAGRTRTNDNYKNIVDHNQKIRDSRAAVNVVSIADDKAQNASITQANPYESKSDKELDADQTTIQKELQTAQKHKQDKNPKTREFGAKLEAELNAKLAKLEAERAKRRNKPNKQNQPQQTHQKDKKQTFGNDAALSKSHDYNRDLDRLTNLKDNQERQSKANNNRLNQESQRVAQQVDAQRDAQAQQTKQQQDGTAREADKLFNQMSDTYGEEHTQQARQRFNSMSAGQQTNLLNNLPTTEKLKGERAGDFMNAINRKYETEVYSPTWGASEAPAFITSAERMKQLKPQPSWKKYATPRPR